METRQLCRFVCLSLKHAAHRHTGGIICSSYDPRTTSLIARTHHRVYVAPLTDSTMQQHIWLVATPCNECVGFPVPSGCQRKLIVLLRSNIHEAKRRVLFMSLFWRKTIDSQKHVICRRVSGSCSFYKQRSSVKRSHRIKQPFLPIHVHSILRDF